MYRFRVFAKKEGGQRQIGLSVNNSRGSFVGFSLTTSLVAEEMCETQFVRGMNDMPPLS